MLTFIHVTTEKLGHEVKPTSNDVVDTASGHIHVLEHICIMDRYDVNMLTYVTLVVSFLSSHGVR